MNVNERGYMVITAGASGLEAWSAVYKSEENALATIARNGGTYPRQYFVVPALGVVTNQLEPR